MSTEPVIFIPSYEIVLRLKHVILLFLFLFVVCIIGYFSGYLYEIERYIDAKDTSSTELH
jgi:hypothetical protein